MSKPQGTAGPSRRSFASVAFGGVAATALFGRETTKEITQASVPGDPIAPKIQPGTVAEQQPFAEIEFRRHDVPLKMTAFALSNVRLLLGVFRDAQEADRALLLRLPADRLLHTFRLNAGLPSSAEPLGGWERPSCELRGHFAGHFLSACALMYASTGDREVKAKGDYMVAELAKCQHKLGGQYLSAFPLELFDRLKARKEVWAPFYTIHKIMAGMLDMQEHCGNAQALEVLKSMAGWADEWTAALTEEQLQVVLDTEYGGMNEVLYNLAAVTGDDRFALVGDRFTKKRFFNPLALRRDQLRGLHTNTHIPQVIGAARRYEISGDRRFRDVADYFWDEVVGTRTYVTGGTSNNEGWLVEPNHLAEELRLGTSTNECCCAYNMMKLTRKLYTWTGDPRYFDYYERALYNHRLGTIDTNTGATQYYLGIVPGSWRTFATEHDSFWCCNGTGVEEYGKLTDSIYFHDGHGLYVNLFIPSEVNWLEKQVRVRQTNRFPEEAATHFTLETKQPLKLAVHVRIPSWISGFPIVRINGKPTEISAAPNSYVSILRTWRNGDRIDIELPMQLHVESMPDNSELQAILYGPLVLAGELGDEELARNLVVGPEGPDLKKHPAAAIPSFTAKGKQPDAWIESGSTPLTFQTTGQPENVKLVPFGWLKKGRYSVYWNVT